MAINNPENLVMKPQREGGGKCTPNETRLIFLGNNFYGVDVREKLLSLNPEERNAYILMELIKPPSLKNIMMRKGELLECSVISELGVYGTWVSDGEVVHLNESAGHLLRTKTSQSQEGGVAAGFGVLDSPFLV